MRATMEDFLDGHEVKVQGEVLSRADKHDLFKKRIIWGYQRRKNEIGVVLHVRIDYFFDFIPNIFPIPPPFDFFA